MTSIKDQPVEVARIGSQAKKLYTKLVKGETRTELLRCLQVRRVGTPEVEEFLKRLYKRQGKELGIPATSNNLGRERIIKLLLESKIRNAEREEREMRRKYWRMRGKLQKELGNKRKVSKIVTEIRDAGKNLKIRIRRKNKEKVEHLENKYRQRARVGLNELIVRYKDTRIFEGG